MVAAVVQIDAWDPVASAVVTLRAASHDDPRVCHLNGQTWWPVIGKLPTLRYDLFDGAFAGQITAPTSTMEMAVEAWPNFGRYALADARFQLWTGEPGAAWASWTQRFDGRVTGQPKLKDGTAQIEAAVDDRWLDASLLTTYLGTTGAEGPAALKGQAKPLALGAPLFVPGKLIDSVNSVFQVSSYGAVQGFTAATERLLRFGASAGDYASYAALVAATIPPGRWATAKAVGMARFGAPPNGTVSFLLGGDAAGPDGWARKPGEIIRRLALLSGGAGKIDDSSLDALDAARPYNLSLYVDGQTTGRELIQRIAMSINAVAGVDWLGRLFVIPVGFGTPSLTLAADGSALPQIEPAEQIEVSVPWRKLSIGAERSWTVYALADIAFEAPLVDMGDYVGTTTYREGNLVQSGGATWLYFNPTPTAGNAPPTPPATSNSWWKVLAQAGEPGAPGDPGDAGDPGEAAVAVSAQPETITVACDSGGTPKSGELPRAIANSATQGGAAATISSVAIVGTPSGCTASVAGSTVTITAVSADSGSVTYDVTAAGQTVRKKVTFTKAKDGADGGSGGGTQSVLIGLTGGTLSGIFIAAGATVSFQSRISANAPAGSGSVTLDIEIRPSGSSGSWTAVGSGSTSYGAGDPWTVLATGSFTAGTSDQIYDVRAVGSGGTGTLVAARSFLRTA